MPEAGALAGVRVLEIAGPFGDYAGKLLADLGADVVVVEPPAGATGRREPPFLADRPGVERSLAFAHRNTSKRGITLDLDRPEGQELFHRLLADVDVVLDGTGDPATMARRGLGAEHLVAAHPRLVHTVVTPFGLDGPYADHAATDLVLMALGGLLSLGGYRDGPPVRAFGDQARLAAGQFAAIGTLLAVLAAEDEGEGQVVDVSAQDAVVMAHENAVQFYDLEGVVKRRNGGDARQAAVGIYPCQDGHVYLLAKGLGVFWDELVGWLEAEGVAGATGLRDAKWKDDDFAASAEGRAEFLEIFGGFSMQRTKAELYEAAKRIRLPLCPVNDPADLAASPQLEARGFLVDVEHAASGTTLRMPGVPYQFSATPAGVSRPAPQLGEHTGEVLAGAGLTPDDLVHLAAAGVV